MDVNYTRADHQILEVKNMGAIDGYVTVHFDDLPITDIHWVGKGGTYQ